jgi:hypothetical protein
MAFTIQVLVRDRHIIVEGVKTGGKDKNVWYSICPKLDH